MRGLAWVGVLVLGGCVLRGDAPRLPVAFEQTMASDTASQMARLHPPASTHFRLQDSGTGFGAALVEELRLKGYAVEESSGPWQRLFNAKEEEGEPEGLVLRPILDRVESLYRVQVAIGEQTLSRVYAKTDKTAFAAVVPAGAWTWREEP